MEKTTMLITNDKQKRQNKFFVDEDHEVMSKFYEIIESGISATKMIQEMKRLIEKDADFYDPYLVIADILFSQGKDAKGSQILQDAYERAVTRISDSKGRWPKEMVWGFLENRHLMRAIEQYGILCWENNEIDKALDILRRLFHMNPEDNQGIRYDILAIKLGLGMEEWQKPFEYIQKGQVVGLDAVKVSKWFEENARKFPEEFQWFFDFHKGNEESE